MKVILTILAFFLVFTIYTKSGSVYKVSQIVYEAPRGYKYSDSERFGAVRNIRNSDWIKVKVVGGKCYMHIPVANIEYIIQEKEE